MYRTTESQKRGGPGGAYRQDSNSRYITWWGRQIWSMFAHSGSDRSPARHGFYSVSLVEHGVTSYAVPNSNSHLLLRPLGSVGCYFPPRMFTFTIYMNRLSIFCDNPAIRHHYPHGSTPYRLRPALSWICFLSFGNGPPSLPRSVIVCQWRLSSALLLQGTVLRSVCSDMLLSTHWCIP